MPIRFILAICLLAAPSAGWSSAGTPFSISHLTCEYLTDPLGIDQLRPSLGWQLSSPGKGLMQSAYQVLVASSRELLDKNTGDVWNSGKVLSAQSQHIRYAGPALQAGKYYYWKVKVWNGQTKNAKWSSNALWSMGLLSEKDWQGQWISGKYAAVSSKRASMDTWGKNEGYTSPDTAAMYFRKSFIQDRQLKKATAYVSGLGYYELYMNGHKISNRVMDPAFTDYQVQVNYITHDVTRNIKKGQNTIGVILGNGFYNTPTADLFQMQLANWKTPPKVIVNLRLEYTDGQTVVIATDTSWKWHTGEIVYNSIRSGETIDHRATEHNWNNVPFNDAHWLSAITVPPPTGKLTTQYIPPMRVNEVIKPERITEPKKGTYLVDFGKNITGWVSLHTKGVKGQQVDCWYNEALTKDSTLNKKYSASHTKGRFQQEIFILNGEGKEYFEPRFTYHGFRYVQLEGLSAPPSLNDIQAKSVHTSLDTTGYFSSSSTSYNHLQKAIQRTLLNSIHGMPAEEPTREKMGWTLDAWVTMESYLYNFDAINAYKKSLQDYIDAQEPSGHIASIVPTNGWAYLTPAGTPVYFDDPWWGGTIFLITDQLFEFTGDTAIIAHAFPALKRYLDFISTTAKNDLVYWSLGDWLDLTHKNGPGLTPVAQTSTAGYYWMSKRLSVFANLIGEKNIAAQYAVQAENIKDKFNAAFLDSSTGWYAKNSQTAQALPLYLDMVPAAYKQKVEARLMDAIAGNNDHVSAGFIGVLPLLNYLSTYGHMNTAYKMVSQKESPGWLQMVKDEKSTLGENLNNKGYGTGHHPYGAHIGSWLFKYLGGIRPDKEHPGFQQFIISPQFMQDLDGVTLQTQSLYGKMVASWKRTGNTIQLDITIPGNTTAKIILPPGMKPDQLNGAKILEGNILSAGSGNYRFTITD
ncbi:Bacterial alpha-L-rhamnosidase [Chitinophaga sp. SYP-B3965]|uniref:alpha-L-rhamnosidase n=1 Tax=Chitinophaga sp. SYP-B3965 TaxID=2663120 RepID=UPI001299EF20|nr:alpha-L-rhamnosidase [Chitinophaga sp. SYP-B3965]MRG45459.1 Bacterial alpha-L-rhamnosidase [Chitinophaga sp. SYP-B3965]